MAWGSDEALNPPETIRPPGWCELGMEYTLAEPQRDPAVTAAIEALDPTFTPIGIRWIFLAPADAQTSVRETHVFLYHGIGRTSLVINSRGLSDNELRSSMDALKLPPFEIPPSYSGRVPLYLDPTVGILDDTEWLGLEPVFPAPRDKFGAADLPGPFIPWDWALVAALKRCYTSTHTAKDLKDRHIWNPLNARRKRVAAAREDFAAAMVDFQTYAKRKIEAASDEEIVTQMAKQQEASRKARLKRLAAAVQFRIHGVS